MPLRKKTTLFALLSVLLVAVVFLVSPVALAQSLDFPTEFAGLQDADLKEVISNIVKIALGFLGILAVLFILWGGFVWFTSGGNEEKISRAKKIIVSSVIGLVLILLSYAISSFIITSLVTTFNPGTSSGGPPGPGPGPTGIGNGIIENHYPRRNATNIPRNTRVLITFKEEIDSSTMNSSTITIASLETTPTVHTATVLPSVDNLTFVIEVTDSAGVPELMGSPSGDIKYQVSLSPGIEKATCSVASCPALPVGYAWVFTVSNFSDTTPPTIESVIPRPASTVARNTIVQINFSEAIDPTTSIGISPGFTNITVDGDASGIAAGQYTISNGYKTVEFLSSAPCGPTVINSCGEEVFCLFGPDNFTGTVTSFVTDLAGLPIDPSDPLASWNFLTTNDIELDPPFISEQFPTGHNITTGFDVDDDLRVHFNKPMSRSTLNSTNIKLPGVGYWIDANWTAGEEVVTIGHSRFAPQTDYNVAVSSQVKDTYQNCFNPCECSDPSGSCGCKSPVCNGTNCTSLET